MGADFDLKRITELRVMLGAEADAIVASMVVNMTTAIAELEETVPSGQFDRATQAAHLCRNDALMLGAGALQEALRTLEVATRGRDESGARDALERLRAVWSATRDDLAEVSRSP